MDKRERKSRLKDIIEKIDKSIIGIEKFDKKLMEETYEKIDDLFCYLEDKCIVPNSFDTEKMMQEILDDYFTHDEEIMDIKKDIEELTNDVYDHINEMENNSSKKEWEQFFSNIEFIEDIINFEDQGINTVEQFIDHMKKLKTNLQNLV